MQRIPNSCTQKNRFYLTREIILFFEKKYLSQLSFRAHKVHNKPQDLKSVYRAVIRVEVTSLLGMC
jgi:hypothetical protein